MNPKVSVSFVSSLTLTKQHFLYKFSGWKWTNEMEVIEQKAWHNVGQVQVTSTWRSETQLNRIANRLNGSEAYISCSNSTPQTTLWTSQNNRKGHSLSVTRPTLPKDWHGGNVLCSVNWQATGLSSLVTDPSVRSCVGQSHGFQLRNDSVLAAAVWTIHPTVSYHIWIDTWSKSRTKVL
jgi:hypothetical protein